MQHVDLVVAYLELISQSSLALTNNTPQSPNYWDP